MDTGIGTFSLDTTYNVNLLTTITDNGKDSQTF